jgi:Domain of unknown function (DUF1707)
MGDSAHTRASDAERQQAAEALRERFAARRFDTDELSERLGSVYEAKTVSELERLSHDLPALPTSPARRQLR